MARDRTYPELLDDVHGKKVLIWTCNTCSRLCAVGGSSNALKLANILRSDGVDVSGVVSVKAACVMKSVGEWIGSKETDCDVILALTCDMGSKVAGAMFGKPCVNPIRTLGTGYLDESNVPILVDPHRGSDTALAEVIVESGLEYGPF